MQITNVESCEMLLTVRYDVILLWTVFFLHKKSSIQEISNSIDTDMLLAVWYKNTSFLLSLLILIQVVRFWQKAKPAFFDTSSLSRFVVMV